MNIKQDPIPDSDGEEHEDEIKREEQKVMEAEVIKAV
jgi:hypothetical protein